MNEQQFMALPESQRKALQEKLIADGLYAGKADGRYGAGTKAAFEQQAKRMEADAKAAREADLKAKQLEIDAINAQSSKARADAEAASLTSETERRQRYDEQASSPMGLTAKSSANLLAPALGTALGLGVGKGVNYAMDQAQESRNRVLQGVAADRMAGRTTVDGARAGAKLAGAMPLSNPVARTASRMLPHTGLGLLSIGKGAQVLNDSDPNGEFYPQMADRAAGLGYIGTGAGLIKQGLRYAAAPGVAPDAQALAIINSNQIRRNGAPGALAQALSPQTIDLEATEVRPSLPAPGASEAVEKAAPTPGSKAYLQQQAKDLGIKGVTRMTKPQLAEALAKAMGEHGAKRTRAPKIPGGSAGGAAGLAAALAYGMTPDSANAATGEPESNQAEALTNAAAAGGIGYGVSKLADMLKPTIGQALGAAGTMLMPSIAADAYDPSAEQLAMDRNTLARTLPSMLRGGAVEDAYQMAQVPERNTLARALMAGR